MHSDIKVAKKCKYFLVLPRPTWIPLCCKQEYTSYCRNHRTKEVPWSDRFEFVNGWYILIIVSDILTTIGSILKIDIQTKVTGVCWSKLLLYVFVRPITFKLLLILLGAHKLRYLQHLPWDRHHVCVDWGHPVHGLLQEVQRKIRITHQVQNVFNSHIIKSLKM